MVGVHHLKKESGDWDANDTDIFGVLYWKIGAIGKPPFKKQ